MTEETPRPHVVAVPYPGRGHVNPMLSLCRVLASRGALVTFVVTEEWLRLLGPAVSLPSSPLLRFRTIPNVLPSEKGRGSDILGFLTAVFTRMEEPFRMLLHQMDPPPSLVLTDLYMKWPADVAERLGVPAAAALWTQSAAGLVATLRVQESLAARGEEEPVVANSIQYEDGCMKYMPRYDITRSLEEEMNTVSIVRMIVRSISWIRDGSHTLLLTTFDELESDAIGTLQQKLPCKVYSIGPTIPYMVLGKSENDTDYFKWLDLQPKSSVLYVSLGSFFPISPSQLEELAVGLRECGNRFLWVVRSETSIHLQELSGEMGMVVPWCDQLGVLCHPSVGGFLTHCGWNSIQEGVYAGVPMLGFPLVWDQSPNCDLMVENWRIGMRLRGGVGRDVVVGREEIENAIRRLMDLEGNAESKEMRRRARELGSKCRRAVEKAGTSYANLDEFARGMRIG